LVEGALTYSIAIVSPSYARFAHVLRAMFEHPWVSTYQIGFGPPLVRANPKLVEAVKNARSALEKLEAYVEHCLLDRKEQARLALLHRQLLVRRFGPIEAEEAALRNSEVLDLSLSLHAPKGAPSKIAEDMISYGVGASFASADEPDLFRGRFLVRLDDPRNERLLDVPIIAAKVPRILPDSGEPMALELRVHPTAAKLWRAWCTAISGLEGLVAVDIGDPAALARVKRQGELG
jgi:hypothetical protein